VTAPLIDRIKTSLTAPIDPAVAAFARALGSDAGALAVLFYGSNLRTRSLDGVLDFYVLMTGEVERGIWPRVSYRERRHESATLRAKVATMTLATFAKAARGELVDTTIWARFVQPSALAWARDKAAEEQVASAIAEAAKTALGEIASADQTKLRASLQEGTDLAAKIDAASRALQGSLAWVCSAWLRTGLP